MSIHLSRNQARRLALQCQWLDHAPLLQKKEDALKVIAQLSYVQIDTITIVERAHHHTLWSRMPRYKPHWLDELLKEKKIFEYWSHAASYLPMHDYRFSLMRKREHANGKDHWFEQDKKLKRKVLARIKSEGPLQNKDFEASDETRRTWYYWKPAKRALEQLFMEGKLMVSSRQSFQKVYDLTERVLPSDVDITFPHKKDYATYLVLSAIQSQGIVSENEIYYQRAPWKDEVKKAIRKLLKDDVITEVKLEEHESTKFYTKKEYLIFNDDTAEMRAIHILSPFDNLLIQRKRIQRLFDFDYTIECYVPEHKRKFGYFTLPVLAGDQFIARLDPKADRAAKTFFIRNLSFEEKASLPDETLFNLAEKIKSFAAFNGCEKIILEKFNQKKAGAALKQLIKGR